jgi:hypothetical protein
MEEIPPPWHVFPYLQDFARQGAEEQFIDESWRPFWRQLTPAQQEDYLIRWNASEEWRMNIKMAFEEYDAEQDFRESEEHFKNYIKPIPPSFGQKFLLKLTSFFKTD